MITSIFIKSVQDYSLETYFCQFHENYWYKSVDMPVIYILYSVFVIEHEKIYYQ